MADAETIAIEVAYALPERQRIVVLHVPAGTRAAQALELSGLLREFPEIEAGTARLGIFGRLCAGGETLRAGDRLEIYRPLIADPKEARRARVAKARGEG
ncbi:MAG: RnfH family protein [Gammaproteobacteria bacterium]|nr:RnfH family protein [Gammaproteobacteria bacterium]